MKKVFWSNSTAQRTSGYNKQSTQNMFLEKAFECSPNTLQWLPMNQNKQDSENRSVAYYSEVPNYDREQVYNWYQTVPLRHDSFVDDVNPKGTIEEHMNRKGRILNERQKRYRTSFTTFQLGRLEEEFQKDKYAVGMKRMRLASELNLTEKQVKVWFQNRRMKYKRVCQRIHNRRVAMTKYWE